MTDQASLLLRKQLKGTFIIAFIPTTAVPSHSTLDQTVASRLFQPIHFFFTADLMKNPVEGFSAGLVDDTNLFEWAVTVLGPPDTLYEGGFFNAVLSFPKDYPQSPPECRFTSEMWHPNVFPDGKVCISILHPPGIDPMNPQESASERWSPVHTVESIILSIISMLSSPNDESPANIDAAKDWRENRAEFKKKVARIVRKSQEML